MNEFVGLFAQSVLPFFRGINSFLIEILSVPICNILASFALSVLTAKISFNIFLITEPNLKNLSEALENIEAITNKNNYKNFLREYCLTTGLLVTAITNLQFRYTTSLHTVIIYSIFGPYLIRDKLYKVFKERKKTAIYDAVNNISENKLKSYKDRLEDKLRDEGIL